MSPLTLLILTLLLCVCFAQQPQPQNGTSGQQPQPQNGAQNAGQQPQTAGQQQNAGQQQQNSSSGVQSLSIFPPLVKSANVIYTGQIIIWGRQYNITNGTMQYKNVVNNGTDVASVHNLFTLTKDQGQVFQIEQFNRFTTDEIDWYSLVQDKCLYYQFSQQKGTLPQCDTWEDRGNNTFLRTCYVMFHNQNNSNQPQQPQQQQPQTQQQSQQQQINLMISSLIVLDKQNRIQSSETIVIDQFFFPVIAIYRSTTQHLQEEPADSIFEVPPKCTLAASQGGGNGLHAVFGVDVGLRFQNNQAQ